MKSGQSVSRLSNQSAGGGGLDEGGFYVLCFMFYVYVYDGRERGVQMRLSPGLRLRGERWNTSPGPKKRESRERERDPDWIGFFAGGGGSSFPTGLGF